MKPMVTETNRNQQAQERGPSHVWLLEYGMHSLLSSDLFLVSDFKKGIQHTF